MDKKRLNNEIILCRPMVRKARVAVIRKILKKMKILKSCKNEAVKEKKLKKSERLFEKVQIMKRVKNDDVTKFALRNTDLEGFLKKGSVNLKENALACLAKHEAVAKRIASIRDKMPNWEVCLPLLLDSLGRKKLGTKAKKKQSDDKQVKTSNSNTSKVPEMKKTGIYPKENIEKKPKANKDFKSEGGTVEIQKKVDKIDDPFFIHKKVIPPKLVTENTSEKLKEGRIKKDSVTPFPAKPFKTKKDSNKFNGVVQCHPVQEDEKLHPSWAAKKSQAIKPFLGKKIKFSED